MVNRPTVQLKLVDADGLYYSWRWEHELGAIQNIMVEPGYVQPALDALAEALPTPLPGETVDQALQRSLTGPLTDRDREAGLATALAAALIPYQLAVEMNALLERGLRPHVRIQPSLSTAQVPWEALRVDEGERFVTNADVSVLPPATVRNAPERRRTAWNPDGPVVAVLDPKIPGAGRDLGSVLGDVPDDAPLITALGERRVPSGPPARRGDLDRDVLEPLLAGAARFLYVGHVTTAKHGLDARLHLSCGPATTGRAAVVNGHRPLTAADLLLGHRPGPAAPWRMPNRVALIACESGGEVRFAEPVGLVAAAVHTGASYVTATRWTLPTDEGLRHFAPGATASTTVLPEAILAVNTAHDADDPVAALNAWQRDKAARWEAAGRLEDSPAIWAAFATAYA
ncbi:CHAT domain-containing protein [Glycomyces artemisiae]|uniref:CHAT domain-containing protein n=1 Tax=Glycomyces artemisiae TaxID=1076443 RepID=A0A2T0UCV6_9ACTN|nr:CHAT domain-containing protein [Glycomyces artemisiae]PRY55771.1 CHAT domain-containing protein [Glycomyces artemisiae]